VVGEALEGRRLMSVASLSPRGNLRISLADQSAGATLTVGLNEAGTEVTVTGGGLSSSFSLAAVRRLVILGSPAADTINTSAFSKLTHIVGGQGNDTITTGAGRDLVDAGRGDDSVTTGAGDDVVHGGDGADSIAGEAGNDRLWGGKGVDSINGGEGDDILGAVLGTNNIIGGPGRDTFVINSSNPLSAQTSDFDSATDILRIRGRDEDGATPPAAP